MSRETFTWLRWRNVVGHFFFDLQLDERYGSGRNSFHAAYISSSQMRYMIPIRRAHASVLPRASFSKIRWKKSLAARRSCLLVASSDQSKACPVWCSEVGPSDLSHCRP